MTTATQPLHLHRLTVDSFLRIESQEVPAAGQHVIADGDNGTGKTSFINALWVGLKGLEKRQFPEAVHHGAHEAHIRIELANGEGEVELTIERTINSDGSNDLDLRRSDGSKVRVKPQKLLDALTTDNAFDLNAFLEEKPGRPSRIAQCLAVAGVKPPVDQVEEITGERFAAEPGESAADYLDRLAGDNRGHYYEERRRLHRIATDKRAAQAEQEKRLVQLGGALTKEERDLSTTDLLKKLDGLQAQQDKCRTAETDASNATADAEDVRRQMDLVEQELRQSCSRIEALRKQLADEEQNRVSLQDRVAKGANTLRQLEEEAKVLKRKAEALPDPAPEIAQVRQQLADLEATNKRLATRRAAGDELSRLSKETAKADADHQHLDEVLGQLRKLRGRLLEGVDFGVQALEVDWTGLRVNGQPWTQASKAEQIKVACAVAFKQDCRLKLLRIDDAESLSPKNQLLVLQLASEAGWQVFMTTVSGEDKVRFRFVPVAA